MSQDQHAGLTKILVSTRVIPMPMRVEDEANRFFGDRPNRRSDLLGQRRVLVIDEKYTVRPRRDRQIASRALKHHQARAEIGPFDLDLREILLRRRREGPDQEQRPDQAATSNSEAFDPTPTRRAFFTRALFQHQIALPFHQEYTAHAECRVWIRYRRPLDAFIE